jgi:hypothetical protein
MNYSERIALALGNRLPDSSSLIVGCNPIVSTTEVTLWCESTKYAYPLVATTMTLSSSDAEDNATGDGARTLRVSGLDSEYNFIQETLTLNGLTAVPTINEYLRISNIRVVTAGLREPANIGDIYLGTGVVSAGIPAVVYERIVANVGISRRACHTVPRGREALVAGLMVRTERNADVQARMYAAAEGGPMIQRGSVPVFASGFNLQLSSFLRIPEKTDIEIRTRTDAGTYRVMGVLELFEFAS